MSTLRKAGLRMKTATRRIIGFVHTLQWPRPQQVRLWEALQLRQWTSQAYDFQRSQRKQH